MLMGKMGALNRSNWAQQVHNKTNITIVYRQLQENRCRSTYMCVCFLFVSHIFVVIL